MATEQIASRAKDKSPEPTNYTPGRTRGVITDDGVAQLSARIGIEKITKPGRWPHNLEVTQDAIRHYAFALGDDNPLYSDPQYAATTRWNGLIAPPLFVWTMGERQGPASHDAKTAELMRGDPLSGVGALQADMYQEFYRPLRIGDRMHTRETLVAVVDKPSNFSGRTVHSYVGKVGYQPGGEVLFYQRGMWARHERRDHSEKKRTHEIAEPYSSEQLEEIDAVYASESRRGNAPLLWEDVVVGESLPTRVRGPLKLTDLLIWHIGWGMGGMTPGYNFKMAYEHRKRKAGMYSPDHLNVPDTVQRMHWEESWAKQVGMPARYDYGAIREAFLAHLATDWIGDDGFLFSLWARHRRLNFFGDTTWIKGRVAGKAVNGGRHEVTLEVWCENQRGETTTEGKAVVILPSASGPAVLPKPPASDPRAVLRADIDKMASSAAEDDAQ